MAESIIIKDKREAMLIAESGSANETYKAKLMRLYSAYNSLSSDQKKNAFLLMNNNIFNISDIGTSTFTMFRYITAITANLSTGAYSRLIINSNGSTTTDDSAQTSTYNIQLYIR